MTDLAELSAEDFESRLGTAFRVPVEPEPLDLVLVEVQRLVDARRTASGAARPGTLAFSLVWHGPLAPILPQRVYPLEHPELGRSEVFIVPLGPEGGVMRYQAVFY
jgi:hypothetical protein